MDGEAKTTMATSIPLLQAAVHRAEIGDWHSEDKKGTMMKGRGAMTTKIMGQDDTDTNNEGTGNNNNNNGDQGMKTDDKEGDDKDNP